MTIRTIETEDGRKMLVRFIESHKLPFIAELTAGKRRSVEQNKLQRKWMTEIAEQLGDRTAEEVRAYCKLTIGVPLLREQNETFRTKYDEVVKPLTYEQKLSIMSEPLDMPVTRLMTTKQKTTYLDTIFRHFSEKGIVLTQPPDKRYGLPIEHEQPDASSPNAPSGLGSGDPVSPEDPAADPIASQESGKEAGANSGETSAPASERSMVNSARPMNTQSIKAEMVRKLLQLAGDKALTKDQRLENLESVRPVWTKSLTGFPTVVTQAFSTAEKIINGEVKPDDGRRLMENLV